jgi:hypothetical protein
MLSWSEFASDEPAMAAAGAALLYQFGGVGLAFLATTRGDGVRECIRCVPSSIADSFGAF